MNLDTATSIGLAAYKHRDQIGSALNGVSKLMGGNSFGNIFNKLENKLDPQTETSDPNTISSLQALSGFAFFDADRNGQLSQQELTDGLQKVDSSNISNKASTKLFGQKMLENYGKTAALDNNSTSISLRDLGQLATKDGKLGSISTTDWQKVST